MMSKEEVLRLLDILIDFFDDYNDLLDAIDKRIAEKDK